MGQLEKYGLYVLCLVIFLILGVTIWGGGDVPTPGDRTPAVAMHAPGGGATGSPARGDTPAPRAGRDADRSNLLDSMLKPLPPPSQPAKQDGPNGSGPNGGTGGAGGSAEPAIARHSDGTGAAPADSGGPSGDGGGKQPAASPGTRVYTVRRGDSFDAIARRELGDANRREEIAKLNPGVDPKRIQPGQELRLPVGEASSAKPSEPAPKSGDDALRRAGAHRIYTVADGDTLGAIARRELGSVRRLEELRKLNPDVDPRLLRVGQKIKLPLE